MTIDELGLVNFGIYRGEHSIKLAPPSPDQPIILFGGMNGSGKTTLLDALQLVLHGKRAHCSNRGSKSYEDFLLSCINRHVDPSDGASLELKFRYQTEGGEHAYRVRRTWRSNGSGINENVEVFLDGAYDALVSQSWPEYAEEFIPEQLAHFFFFDGERIEALADLENASELLRTGIHSLLGLDIADRLDSDLLTLISRKERVQQPTDSLREVIARLRTELSTLEERSSSLFNEYSTVATQLEQAQYRRHKVQERLQKEGGELFREKDFVLSSKRDLELQLELSDNQLRELAGGAAPMILVSSLLRSAARQAQLEERAAQAQFVANALTKRDKQLFDVLQGLRLSSEQMKAVRCFLDADLGSRSREARANRYLMLSNEAYGLLHDLTSSALSDLRDKLVTQLERRSELAHHLTVVERKLKTIPDEDAIKPLLDELREMEQRCDFLERERRRLEEERRRVAHEMERRQAELGRHQRQAVEQELESEESARIVAYSRLARSILKDFRQRVVERHIEAIQQSVLESFHQLIRKRHLIAAIRIDPHSFEVQLQANDGQVVLPERLSAGERQLLAVSLLWGLAKASRRPLPTVIDTPLGRLDSSHRGLVVRRYFPKASHQVLLLSTDEEIRGEYLMSLRSAVGHFYTLEFHEPEESTRVREGYFGREHIHATRTH